MKRVLTSLILIPLVLYIVILGRPWLAFGAVTLCAMLCYREYCGIAAGFGVTRLGPVGFAAGLGVLALSDGSENLAYTVTNEFGEFRAEIVNSGDLEIFVPGGGGEPITISLRHALDVVPGVRHASLV